MPMGGRPMPMALSTSRPGIIMPGIIMPMPGALPLAPSSTEAALDTVEGWAGRACGGPELFATAPCVTGGAGGAGGAFGSDGAGAAGGGDPRQGARGGALAGASGAAASGDALALCASGVYGWTQRVECRPKPAENRPELGVLIPFWQPLHAILEVELTRRPPAAARHS